MINKKNVFVICFLFLNKNNIYASSVSNFLGTTSPNAISLLHHDKPVDLARNDNNKFLLLRIPYNNEIAGDNDKLIIGMVENVQNNSDGGSHYLIKMIRKLFE